jgi:hypothetical protein
MRRRVDNDMLIWLVEHLLVRWIPRIRGGDDLRMAERSVSTLPRLCCINAIHTMFKLTELFSHRVSRP